MELNEKQKEILDCNDDVIFVEAAAASGKTRLLTERIRKDFHEHMNDEEILLPFEFIIGSLFPSSYDAIKDAMMQQYIEGYNKGYEEGKNDET